MNYPHTFTGYWFPRPIVQLLEEKVIDHTDFVLFGIVSALGQSEDACYASNRYLAKVLGWTNKKSVSRRLKKLTDLNLITITRSEDNKRLILVPGVHYWFGAAGEGHSAATRKQAEGHSAATRHSLLIALRSKAHNKPLDIRQSAFCGPGFFGGEHTSDKIYQDMAQYLHKFLAKKGMVMRKPSLSAWARQFSLLNQKDKVSTTTIKKVLKWYRLNCGKKYVPRVCSAKSFRDRFDQLHNCSKDTTKEKAQKTSEPLAPELEAVKRRVESRGWPERAMEKLSDTLQASYTFHKQAKKALITLNRKASKATTKEGKLVAKFTGLLLRHYQGSEASWVEQYFIRLHEDVKDWKEWSGSIASYVMTFENKHYVEYHRGLCRKWCGNTKAWDETMKKLNL